MWEFWRWIVRVRRVVKWIGAEALAVVFAEPERTIVGEAVVHGGGTGESERVVQLPAKVRLAGEVTFVERSRRGLEIEGPERLVVFGDAVVGEARVPRRVAFALTVTDRGRSGLHIRRQHRVERDFALARRCAAR